MMKKGIVLAVAAFSVALAGGQSFANELEDAVKARQSFFQVVVFNARPLFAMMKGSVDYNAEAAQTHADNLKALTELKNDGMWLKGSSKADLPGKTRALPAIWESGATFGEKAEAWSKAIGDLAGVAGKGKDEMVPKVRALAAACSACHKEFRADDF